MDIEPLNRIGNHISLSDGDKDYLIDIDLFTDWLINTEYNGYYYRSMIPDNWESKNERGYVLNKNHLIDNLDVMVVKIYIKEKNISPL